MALAAAAIVVLLILAGGGAYALKLGPFASASPSTAVIPSFPPGRTPPPLPTSGISIPPLPSGGITIPSIGVPTPVQPTVSGFSLPPIPTFSFPPIPSFSIPPFPSFSLPPIPSFSLPPIGNLTPEQQALLQHVPQDLRQICAPSTVPTPGANAQILCATLDGAAVNYAQFPDKASMDAAYATFLQPLGATTDSGQCSNAQWPQENAYTVSNQPAGRLVCGLLGTLAEIAWTHDPTNILTFAIRADGNQSTLYQLWLTAGPD